MKNVVVFASGTGSNFVNLAQNKQLRKYMKINLLVCDNEGAKVIEEAKKFGIETLVFNPKNYLLKKEYENMILKNIKGNELILLAGYMRILSPYFLDNFEGDIINIHPSLLPMYKGIESIKRAYDNRDEEIGVTIHYVNEEVDGGEILAQEKFKVDYRKSLDEITEQVHKLEHRLYPKTLTQLLSK